ncbi:hypothetical protein A2961_04145 [Candidatus Woesebacteria bacterium RIFCSPLOWO2_01_FULL_39_21]|uniref:Recombinase family protein n=1 Tax=Candidatus Woesebacteria bacterium RIFCSPLOWO2_01_FULL_39_21 TaxID=1802519 RepID=A0A1F8BC53_9BACT|nr:MAG: hypothetical protein A2961_04145 [Candidatus Woesebacteria bacterium RIFCSPLOWO2_01_FULL_39_21]
MEQIKLKRVAAYCRVSTERQKDEQTIEVQQRFIKEWAEQNNSIVVEWYLDDGWSGDTLERPELDRFREDANKESWEAAVFIDRDRLARTLAYQEFVIRELSDKYIEVIFINNPLATDPIQRSLQQVYGIFAEIERITIAERMRKGKIHKAKSGKLVGHNAPYGYRYHPKVSDKDGYFEIYEPEAEIIRMIFHWVADESYSMRGVVRELYKRKIPSAKGKARWVKSSVERLLNREDYIGTSYYNRRMAVVPRHPQKVNGYKKIKKSSRVVRPKEEWIAIPVPPIIDKELFAKAHRRLRENQIYNWRNKKYDYLLVNKIYCQCGSRRVGDGVKGHHYYRCAQRIYKYPLPNKCDYEGVNAEILDSMTWNKLVSLFAQKDLVKSQVLKWKLSQHKIVSKSESELERLKSALERLTGEERRLVDAYRVNLISFGHFKESVQEIKAKKETLELQAKELNETSPDEEVNLDSFEDICETLFYSMRHADVSLKRDFIKRLIISIYVGERRKALVNGRIPLIAQGQNIQDVLISRDSLFAVPQFDFYFRVNIPKANKERLIMERDYLGRIVVSKVQEAPNYYAEK